MTTTSRCPILDRKSYLDGPIPVRVAIREQMSLLMERFHERYRQDMRNGILTPDQENTKYAATVDSGAHMAGCRPCRLLYEEAIHRRMEGQLHVAHRDNTFADPTTSFDFECESLAPDWHIGKLNSLKWDEMNAMNPPDALLAPTSREMAQLRGFRWDINQRPSRIWISNFRDDDTFHRRQNGNVITVVMVPLDVWWEDVTDDHGNIVCKLDGSPLQRLREESWRWCVVQCEMVTWVLNTPDDLRRFQRKTGLKAKAKKGYRRDVLTPLDKLPRDYLDLDEARDHARWWYGEQDDLDDAWYRERPIYDPDVLYNARVEVMPEAAFTQIRGPVVAFDDDDD